VRAPSRAQAYDRHTGRYGPELAAAFIGFAGIGRGVRVLDVGCGPGALTQELAQAAEIHTLAAVDPSEEYVSACAARVPGVDARVGTGEDLPFADASFDAVLAQLVVQALDDAPRAVREMFRVAAPDGVVATCVWDFGGGMPLLDAYWAAARAVDPEGAGRAAADEVNPWCTPDGLRRLWDEAGADAIDIAELMAGAGDQDVDDAWYSFAVGVSMSGAYCRSLDEERRAALYEEFRRRLGVEEGPFRLDARAWAVRGRASAAR